MIVAEGAGAEVMSLSEHAFACDAGDAGCKRVGEGLWLLCMCVLAILKVLITFPDAACSRSAHVLLLFVRFYVCGVGPLHPALLCSCCYQRAV